MKVSCILVVLLCQCVLCKVFERCELVRELSKKKHRIPSGDLGTWVCIARHESQFNTSAVGHLNADLSGDHGLFQISDQYWCSPPGVGEACGLNCDQLEDDDITDDVICARRIYRAHKRRTGDGFTAWAVYGPHCRGDNSAFTEDCDESTYTPTTRKPETTTTVKATSTTARHKPKPYTATTFKRKSTTTIKPSTTETDSNITEGPSLTTSSLEEASVNSVSSTSKDYKGHQLFLSKELNADIDSPTEEPVPTPQRARLYETSFPWNQRPTLPSPSDNPAIAWLKIHYNPRFLDEFS